MQIQTHQAYDLTSNESKLKYQIEIKKQIKYKSKLKYQIEIFNWNVNYFKGAKNPKSKKQIPKSNNIDL